MSDQHKPLTVAEIEVDILASYIDNPSAWESFDQGVSDAIASAVESIRALLSLLTPPTDAKCKCDLRTQLVGDGCAVCNPELAAEMGCPPTDVEVRDAVERLGRFATDLEGCTSFQAGKSVVAMIERDLRTLLRAVQAPRLPERKMEVLRYAAECLYGLSAGDDLRREWPEAFGKEG